MIVIKFKSNHNHLIRVRPMSQRHIHRLLNGKAYLLLRLHFKFTRVWLMNE